tara:strand:- start:251 stop:634 length:384 start_codon:yes stop_codon:yes gene_type:complete
MKGKRMANEIARIEPKKGVVEGDKGRPDNIPPATWAALSEAGHVAAERLLSLLQGPAFMRLKAGDQARLIELAMNRAYGPPIKRELSLSLSGQVSDAVAESLGRLAGAELPEMRTASARQRDTTGRG